MQAPENPSAKRGSPPRRSALRRLVQTGILFLIFLLIFRAVAAEPYQVPTGSMWPALAGKHRAMDCPRCGYPVVVGRHRSDHGNRAENARLYRTAFCPNCGCTDLGIADLPECPGDHVLVNKNVFDFRRPRRWEMVVFRSPSEPGKAFVKRIVGLPGERLHIRDGDIYINGALARKTLDEFKALRIPVFDNNYQPSPDGFRDRWVSRPALSGASPVQGKSLCLQGKGQRDAYHVLEYRHYGLDEHQYQPIQDEYAYNCGDCKALVSVHDLMMECDLRVERGSGSVRFGITDGAAWVMAEIPVGAESSRSMGEGTCLRVALNGFAPRHSRQAGEERVYRRAPGVRLQAGRTYHVELALVDRRVTLAIDSRLRFQPLDLPVAKHRADLVRPIQLGARGVNAVVINFRLFRDIHYTQAGNNGVGGVVSLGPEEYFVLGDNSPNSDDSRFWPNRGAVPQRLLIGKPFLAHMPSRVVRWGFFGDQRGHIVPDLGRVRWLR